MQLIYKFCLLSAALFSFLGHAQSSCDSVLNSGKKSCDQAIHAASNSPTSGSGGSNMGLNAALMNLNSTSQIGDLNTAIAECQKQKKQCQASCSSTSPSPSTLGSSAGTIYDGGPNDPRPKCPAGQTHNNGDCNPSPLIVQLPPRGQLPDPIVLTSRIAGVLFDILGINSYPHPFDKKQISWLVPESRRNNYFLVLPDAQGHVLGIDQLFGNNTLGPDGRFADNGFLALAKFDGRLEDGSLDSSHQDKLINQDDAVFQHLRLWSDLNGDGVAQESELFSLPQLEVQSIDLNYDPNFLERDTYGNEIRTKSVVQTQDGELHLIFDLWFNLN